MTKNVECPHCHVIEKREVVESGQVSHGKPMAVYRFKCAHCENFFWTHEKVTKKYYN